MQSENQVYNNSLAFIDHNEQAKKIVRIFYVLLVIFGVIFVLLYSSFNPYFFLLFFGSSLILVHFVFFTFMILFNDNQIFSKWEDNLQRNNLLKSKMKLTLRYSIPYYIIITGLFLVFYLSGQLENASADLAINWIDIGLIVMYFISVFVSSFIFSHWILENFAYFDSFNREVQLIGINMNEMIKGAIFLTIWWIIQFGLQNYYTSMYQSGTAGSTEVVLGINLLVAILPLMFLTFDIDIRKPKSYISPKLNNLLNP